jgi:hypothetical protein
MATAERERQILENHAFNLRISPRTHGRNHHIAFDPCWPVTRNLSQHQRQTLMALSRKSQQIIPIQQGTAGENPTSHGVEQDIGMVMCCCHRISRRLKRIGLLQKFVQPPRVLVSPGHDIVNQIGSTGEMLR